MKNQKGITLIALVVTVVVIIILAAVSISTLTGNNSTIKNAEDAKSETTIAEEKEILNFSYVSCTGEIGVSAKVTPDQLENKLKESKADTTVIENGNNLEVTFNDTKNKYIVYQDGRIEQAGDSEQPSVETGSYMLDNTTYFDTIIEAIENAQNGSTIKALENTTENNQIDINKNITIDTNGKTITCNNKIMIGANVNITGNGTINYSGTFRGSFIINSQQLTISNVKIISNCGNGSIAGTIANSNQLTVNNSNVIETNGNTAICLNGGTVTINGGNISGVLKGPNPNVIINGGNVETIDATVGGTYKISGGTVNTILLGNNMNDINITIGDNTKPVNTNEPKVGNIQITTGDLAGTNAVINFYNGIVGNLPGEEFLVNCNIRSGYKTQSTSNGIILVPQ